MTSPILFKGAEPGDFTVIGQSSVRYTAAAGTVYWQTGAGTYRSSYARGSIIVGGMASGSLQNVLFLRGAFAASSDFWFTARMRTSFSGNILSSATPPRVISFEDAGGQRRLQIRMTGTNISAGASWVMESVNNSNVATQLGSAFTYGLTDGDQTPNKIDVHVVYGTSGSITVWFNGTQVYSFSGDVTTNSATALASVTLGSAAIPANTTVQAFTAWSEVLISTRDTRRMALAARPAIVQGTGQDWQVNGVGALSSDSTPPSQSGTRSFVAGTHMRPFTPNTPVSVVSVTITITAGAGSGNFYGAIYHDYGGGFSPEQRLALSSAIAAPGASSPVFTFSTKAVASPTRSYHAAFSLPVASTINTAFQTGVTNLAMRGVQTPTDMDGAQPESTGLVFPMYMTINYQASAMNPAPSASPIFADNTPTVGAVQQYVPGIELPLGSFGFAEIAVRSFAKRGDGLGPQHIQFGFRLSGTDYWSGVDVSPSTTTYTLAETAWDTNPATGLPWSSSDLPTYANTDFQIGMKATA